MFFRRSLPPEAREDDPPSHAGPTRVDRVDDRPHHEHNDRDTEAPHSRSKAAPRIPKSISSACCGGGSRMTCTTATTSGPSVTIRTRAASTPRTSRSRRRRIGHLVLVCSARRFSSSQFRFWKKASTDPLKGPASRRPPDGEVVEQDLRISLRPEPAAARGRGLGLAFQALLTVERDGKRSLVQGHLESVPGACRRLDAPHRLEDRPLPAHHAKEEQVVLERV